MSKNLLIVESPAKAKTINNYLGNSFDVVASYGHVRDLPKGNIGIDVEKNFEPTYKILMKAKKNVTAIKKLADKAEQIYLATDLDREGEAIAWHISEALEKKGREFKRVTFSEITKDAILDAVKNPRQLDMDLVDAQQARRIIDRLVGYNLSPLLWKKVFKGLSAGRVQSVAVRLIVEREREIEKFKPDEYWSVEALLEKDKKEFLSRLIEQDGKRINKLDIKTEAQAAEILKKLESGKYQIASIEEKAEKRQAPNPFTTSTLQQESANRLGFTAKRTMMIAQTLYEAGHITYMRTDSLNISEVALKVIRDTIEKTYGKDHLSAEARRFKAKKGAQEAHEAIRPSHADKAPDDLNLDADQRKLYDLIYRRTLATQMAEARLEIVEMKIKDNEFIFLARGQMVKFEGWLKMYPEKITQSELPKLAVGDILNLVELKKDQHFTEPPARYSEATLIKALEERGIGRPSTYAPTISTVQDRGYVIKDKGRLKPEKVGMIVNDMLVENFPDVVDYDFTAKIEQDLDAIAEGKLKWREVVEAFYTPFAKELKEKTDTIERKSMDEELDEKCPDCGKPLILKQTTRGKFIGCTGFPDCHYTRSFVDEKTQAVLDQGEEAIKDRKCPNCGAPLKVASGRFGPFIGCSAYPKCKYIEKIKKEIPKSNDQ